MFSRYQQALRRAPLRTNLCTAVPLMVVGDGFAQFLESRKHAESLNQTFSLKRTTKMAAYSGLVFTPCFFTVYKLADRLFHGKTLLVAVQKAAFTAIAGGIPSNALFLVLGTTLDIMLLGGLVEHESTFGDVVASRLCTGLPELMQASFLFWLPMDSLNFFLASPMYRVMMTSIAAVTWNCYLSFFSHSEPLTLLARPPSCGGRLEDDVVRALRRCMEQNPRQEHEDDKKIRDCLGEVVALLDDVKAKAALADANKASPAALEAGVLYEQTE